LDKKSALRYSVLARKHFKTTSTLIMVNVQRVKYWKKFLGLK
jgi:hypothetical protein